MKRISFPVRYLPFSLSKKDKQKQINMLMRSKKLYKKHKYYTRKNVGFRSKKSNHILNARKIYGIDKVTPNEELSLKTGCSIDAMNKIIRKGEGAYFSSGSRPNQTAQSWGIARLASALTAGKSAAIDYDILEKGCDHRKPAFRLAQKSRKKYGYGHSKTKRVKVDLNR